MRILSFFAGIVCLLVCFGGFSLLAREADDSALRPIKRVSKSAEKSNLKPEKPLLYDKNLPPVQNILKKVEEVDFHVARISGRTSEGGRTAKFSVRLLVRPLKDVNVKIASKDEGEGKAGTETLVFTPDNWDKERVVAVIGQDDDVVDGDREYLIEVSIEGSDDLRYERLPSKTVDFVNKDNDEAGFNVRRVSEISTESGGVASFSIDLKSMPLAPVTLYFSSSNLREGRLEKDQLVFTADNWNQKQTVVVIGQDDMNADGRRSYKVMLAKIGGEDAQYSALALSPIVFYNEDNDQVDLVTSKVIGRASEKGKSARFFVHLKSGPLDTVILDAASSNPAEGTVNPSRLTFTSKNWNERQMVEVKGVDDKIMDGHRDFHIVFSARSSPDKAYRLLKSVKVAVTNDDDDKAGVRFGKVSGNTSEDGKKVRFKAALTSEPLAKVKLFFKSGDPKEGKVITESLEFDPKNWNQEQVITVQGVDDIAADGQRTFQIVALPARSKDPNYNDLNPADIDVINEDNDKAEIIVSAVSGHTSENGDEAFFTVRLATRPSSEVSVEFVTSDEGEGKLITPAIVFNAENWNREQKILVAGVNDAEIDGDKSYSIISYPAQSADSAYNNLDPPDVIVVNVDNNLKSLLIEKTGGNAEGNTVEKGANVSVKISMPSPPESEVYVDISSSNLAEGEPEPGNLVFTPKTWDQEQLVTIKGMDDHRHDGDQPYQIVIKARSPGQPAYNDLPPVKFDFLNVDDDKAGVAVRMINSSSNENGDMAEFGFRLTSEPNSSVVFLLYSSNKKEGELLMEHAAFKKENWNKEKIIRVRGIPDYVVDRHVEYYISCGEGAISGDKDYDRMKFDNIWLLNKNVDSAKFVISPPSGPTDEDGAKAAFTVRLNSKPRARVAVDLWSSNAREGVIDAKRLVFNQENWDKDQVITATGVDENTKDDEQQYRVVFSSADSKDRDYHGLTPHNVDLLNIDNKRISVGLLAFFFKPELELANDFSSTAGFGVSGGYVFNSEYSLGFSLMSIHLTGSGDRAHYHAVHESDFQLDLTSILTGLKYAFLKRPFNIFAQGGGAVHSWSSNISTKTDLLNRGESGVDFGLFGGMGIEFSLIGNSFMSVEYNYHYITLGDNAFMTISVSANYPF